MDTRTQNVDELLRLAKEDISRNSLTPAERTLEQAILMNNQMPDAFHLLGYVYSKKGKFKKAMLAFQRALQLDPFHTEAAIALSSLYNDMGKYKEGAAIFQKAKRRLQRTSPGHDPRINEGLAQRHYELGMMYMRYERFEEAKGEFSKALGLQGDNSAAAVQTAKCMAKTGNREGAIDFLQRHLQASPVAKPKAAETKVQLGVLYHSDRKLKEAHREWQEALALDPDNKTAQMYLSMFD